MLNEKLAKLKPSWRQAYLANQEAERQSVSELTASEAYDWIKDNCFDGYILPMKDTFADYLTKARKELGEQRRSPNAQKSGRSAILRSEI